MGEPPMQAARRVRPRVLSHVTSFASPAMLPRAPLGVRRLHATSASKGAARKQEEEDAADRVLREFDLNDAFGPCLGITRSERWERAKALGLDPPQHVLELVRADASGARDRCLWEGQV
eukprot:jgi/Mesvir1/14250/Mv09686-RA.1